MVAFLSRHGPRVVLGACCVVLIWLFFHVLDLCEQYRAYDYVLASVNKDAATSTFAAGGSSHQQDKVIVIAKLESEDTDWVGNMLPESDAALSELQPNPSNTFM